MALLIYAVIALLLCYHGWKKSSRLAYFSLQCFSFLFIFLFLWLTRENYEVYQIKKLGYSFRKTSQDFKKPARQVLIGGDQQKDDLYFPILPAGALRISPSLADQSLTAEVMQDGILVMRNGEIMNSVALRDGDEIRTGKTSITYRSKGSIKRSFISGGNEWKWPRKKWEFKKIKEPSLPASLTTNFHPLQNIYQALGIQEKSSAIIDMERLVLAGTRQPLRLNAVMLSGYGPETFVNAKPLPASFNFQHQDVIRILSLDAELKTFKATPSLRIRNLETLQFALTDPQTHGIRDSLLNPEGSRKPLLISTSSLPYSGLPSAHYSNESARFKGLIAYVQTKHAEEKKDLPERVKSWFKKAFALEDNTVEIATENGSHRAPFGEVFSLGRSDKIYFVIEKSRFPWLLLAATLMLFLLKGVFQPPFLYPYSNVALYGILLPLDFFFVTRLLFSFRATTVYPYAEETLMLAYLALLLIPYVLFCGAYLSRDHWNRIDVYNFAAYSGAVALTGFFLIHTFLWLTLAIVVLATAAAAYRFSPLKDRYKRLSLPPAQPDVYFFGGLFVCFLFPLSGAGEALNLFGIRFPLALLYHPLLLLGSAYYIREIVNTGVVEDLAGKYWTLVGKLLLFLALFLILSILSADFGFFLLYCIPVFFALAGAGITHLRKYELAAKGRGAAAMAPLLILLLLFSSHSIIYKVLPITYLENRYISRLLLAVDPSVLEETGLIAAEKQLGHKRMFVAYSRSGLLGAGYMERPINPALATTVLNDNVPAGFLLNDFGAAGFFAVILVLVFWGWSWFEANRNSSAPLFSSILSAIAVATLLFTNLYMILANCGIVLFTGKNVFLWGLNSVSDIFHSSLLLLFVLMPIRQTRQAEITGPVKVPVSFDPSGTQVMEV